MAASLVLSMPTIQSVIGRPSVSAIEEPKTDNAPRFASMIVRSVASKTTIASWTASTMRRERSIRLVFRVRTAPIGGARGSGAG